MRKLILAALAAFALAGCATYVNPVTKPRIDTLNASWGTTLAVFDGYRDSCAQRLIPSSCRSVVIYLQPKITSVQSKVIKARSFAQRPTLGTADLIDVASDAVNDLKLLLTDYGVK